MAGHCTEIIALVQRLKHERMYLPGQMKVAVVREPLAEFLYVVYDTIPTVCLKLLLEIALECCN